MQKVQVIQGLNFQSETSIVVIDLQKTNSVVKLLDLIKSFHPIFMSEYKFENEKLFITSKITFLWKELANTLIDLSEEKISYDNAKEYALDTLIKQRIKSMSTIPILYTAHALLYEVTPTVVEKELVPGAKEGYSYTWNRYYTLGSGKNSQITCSISSTKDSIFAVKTQRDKWSTNQYMQRIGLDIPKWQVVKDKEEIEKIWDQYDKPVVIKPTGLTGGSGVTVGIKTLEEAYKAFDYGRENTARHPDKTWQQKIMIQEQVEGDKNGADYRLLVIDGSLKVCTKRIPAFVIGDGKSTIEELIKEENKDPRRDVSNPAHILKPIKIDEPLKRLMNKRGLSLSSIPKKDEKVYVRNIASMSRGGITEDYTDKVGPEIRLMVESLAQSMHAFVLGIDVIAIDISKPLTKDNGGILEVNTMPESYLNFFPVIGETREDALEFFVKRLLKDNKTKQIVVVGHTEKDVPTLLKQKTLFQSYLNEEDVVGEYKNKEISINGLSINKSLEKLRALESLKLNASLDAIIIHHRDWEDVKETGLGFDRIDMLIINSKLKEQSEYYKIIKKHKRKGLIDKIKIV
jgi:D-alanine-D-alanine ligase-like ATP-grasp enzyme